MRPRGTTKEEQLRRAGPIIPGERPQPPDDLEPEEAAEWLAITQRLPEDWFVAENIPLLRELCRHICYARELAKRIAALRAAIAEDGGDPKCESEAWLKIKGLLGLHGAQSDSIVRLATKLRLTQQSRYPAERAEDEQRRVLTSAGGRKPWDDWQNEPSDLN